MAELDKKIQKVQNDLVQSVLEAQEKRNLERVDMLIINAIKQLKMSRFKPDLTTCLSLVYLARINPKLFLQSSAIKENLKSLLRRDSGPANIKGKIDIVLPILAANILLACLGDSPEVNTIILNKIEQWLSANQKVSDLVQHLLASLCLKCYSDKQTVTTLIEMRHHWLQYLYDNHAHYGPVPDILSTNIRQLLHTESNCESLIDYLKFLIRHDTNIENLANDISKFIIDRPISLKSMLNQEDTGNQLYRMLLKIFIKLFIYLKNSPSNQPQAPVKEESVEPSVVTTTSNVQSTNDSKISIKNELPLPASNKDNNVKLDQKLTPDTSSNNGKSESTIKNGPVVASSFISAEDDSNNSESTFVRNLYVKLPNCPKVIVISRLTIEAVLTLMSLAEESKHDCKKEFQIMLENWLVEGEVNQIAAIYEDYGLSSLYNLPDQLRLKLALSSNDLLVELGLQGANVGQLIKLLQSFGCPITTINKILLRLEQITDTKLIKAVIKDVSYFNQLIEFYSGMGASGAKELSNRLEQTTL